MCRGRSRSSSAPAGSGRKRTALVGQPSASNSCPAWNARRGIRTSRHRRGAVSARLCPAVTRRSSPTVVAGRAFAFKRLDQRRAIAMVLTRLLAQPAQGALEKARGRSDPAGHCAPYPRICAACSSSRADAGCGQALDSGISRRVRRRAITRTVSVAAFQETRAQLVEGGVKLVGLRFAQARRGGVGQGAQSTPATTRRKRKRHRALPCVSVIREDAAADAQQLVGRARRGHGPAGQGVELHGCRVAAAVVSIGIDGSVRQ